jgi:hypothetical protein
VHHDSYATGVSCFGASQNKLDTKETSNVFESIVTKVPSHGVVLNEHGQGLLLSGELVECTGVKGALALIRLHIS